MSLHQFKTNCKNYKIVAEPTELPRVKISSSLDMFEFIQPLFEDCMDINEIFVMVILNNANNVMGYKVISEGGITGTIVDVRLVAKYALGSLATSVIFIHNHPSGTLKPSQSDIDLTKKLKTGLEFLDIKVLDHLIVTGKNGYFSFADEHMI